MNSNQQTNTYLIAGAIVVAGALIALGTIFSNPDNGGNPDNNTSPSGTVALSIEPVTENDRIVGNMDASVVLVEYSDFECPFCKQFHSTLMEVVEQYEGTNDFAWVFRHFPLKNIHPKAVREAHAAECAYEQGGNEAFWAYSDRLFEITPGNNGLDLDLLPEIAEYVGLDVDAFNECQDSGRHNDFVDAHLEDAIDAGGRGTPFNVFTVKEPFSEEVFTELQDIRSQFPPNSVQISDDRMRISFSGGLQRSAVISIIELLIDREQ